MLLTVIVTLSDSFTRNVSTEGMMLTEASKAGRGVSVGGGGVLVGGTKVGICVAGGSVGNAVAVDVGAGVSVGVGVGVGSSGLLRNLGTITIARTIRTATNTNAAMPPVNHIQRGKRLSAGTAGAAAGGGGWDGGWA